MSRALGDISVITMGQSPKGVDCNSKGKGVPLLNGPTEFKSHHPSPVQWTTAPNKVSKKKDILFCVRGSTTGRMNWADQEYAIGRGLAAISTQIQGGEHFLRAVVEYNLPSLLAGATGSTFPNVSKKDIEDLPILVNSDTYITGASAILKAIDDKIELNRKMNETLEEIAKAIFKSWFVDFDPVRAKMEGRPTGLPDDIAALFPDRLVDSEIGEIPEGWRHESIYEFCSVEYGAPFKSKQFNEAGQGMPLVRIRDLPKGRGSVFTEEIHPKGTLIKAGDLVVGMDGEFRCYLWRGPDSWMNQRVCKFVPKDNVPTAFIWFGLERPLHFIESTEVATTVIHLGKSDIDGFQFVQSSRELLDLFSELTSSFIDRIVLASRESGTLADLRDTLLPKLISGELQVPDAEKFLEEAGI